MADSLKTGFGKRIAITAADASVGGVILEIEKGKRTDMVFHTHTKKLLYVMIVKLMAQMN